MGLRKMERRKQERKSEVQKANETLTEWLLNIEKIVDKPVIVSLLIKDGVIEYLESRDMKLHYLFSDETSSGDIEEPTTQPKTPRLSAGAERYIG